LTSYGKQILAQGQVVQRLSLEVEEKLVQEERENNRQISKRAY